MIPKPLKPFVNSPISLSQPESASVQQSIGIFTIQGKAESSRAHPIDVPDFDTALLDCAAQTEAFLSAWIDAAGAPARLGAAMRHGALVGGKRLRPFLVRASAALFDISAQDSLPAGAALEMIHCYSLVHDDHPDMDNDELRRGKP